MRPGLAIPPFPGARPPAIARPGGDGRGDPDALLAAIAHHQVGGRYWMNEPWRAQDPVRLTAGDPTALPALAMGKRVLIDGAPADAALVVRDFLTGWQWHDPFSGDVISALQAIELCGFWRSLISANRAITAALGFAHWKQPTVAPLLWNGNTAPFRRGTAAIGARPAVWRSRLTAAQAQAVSGLAVLEVEDGFIRSAGLGADCVPPLSIIVDDIGVHFDPTRPSRLEQLLQNGTFPAALLQRAVRLRAAIVAAGVSKYGRGTAAALPRPGGARRHVLVPGQVEDDRAVTSGGALPSNQVLLQRVRAVTGPEAFLIYKPHPDVLAGHRRGLVDAAGLADHVETSAPMAALIAMVDELHVNSSLAGFEALLRGTPVTTHGVPFYAGWGLTTDLGPVPARRTARRTLDELVAAALLLYPRYLDPVTGLPCPAEVLVQRLAGDQQALGAMANAIVAVRRTAGRMQRRLSEWRSAAPPAGRTAG